MSTAEAHSPVVGRTLVDSLRSHAVSHPTRIACRYLGDGEEIKSELTFADLDLRARAIAARLQGLGAAGESVILLYPPGMEFLSAFMGCLYSGVTAVPLPVPRLKASMSQFTGIIEDLNSRIVLTTATALSRLRKLDAPVLEPLMCLATEDTQSELARAWQEPTITAEAVAYLQYTSGSTSDRKGVMVSHANVITNLLAIAERFEHHADSVSVNWLPHFHDLGLVSGILQPLFHGHPNIMLSPTAFVQQPVRWLRAITRFRGTYSNSPNYGYDLCVRRVTAAQRKDLDLSSWQVALNGAEPVRWQTVTEFSETFAECGFRETAMYPAYGLAEATLVVSGGRRDALPVVLHLDANELERDKVVETGTHNNVRTLIGCGQALVDTEIEVVDPETFSCAAGDSVGEIWVRGPGVAAGYWQRVEETNETYGAMLADGDGRPYLRTGDLGYVRDNELFITGRLKDLIIIRGGNHYPQDIEWTVEQSHPAIRQGCGAAFSVEQDGIEQLVVAYEIERDYLRTVDAHELGLAARKAVAEEHELQLSTLVLLKTGTVPRTSSGKIQRRQCRADFLALELDIVATETAIAAANTQSVDASPTPTAFANDPTTAGASDLVDWLRDYARRYLNSRLMDERRSISPPVILDFGNCGLLGLQVPRSYGGLELGYTDTMQVITQLGAIDQTLTMMMIVHNTLGIGPVLHHAPAALKEQLLPRLASGRELAAFAITEPGAGSNPQGIAATATPMGTDQWSLNGQKSWSGTAGWASVINVFTQNLDAQGQAHGVSGFAVSRGVAGLVIGPEAQTLGMRGMVQNTIYLDNVSVNRTHALGQIGGGMQVAHDAMMQGRLGIGAACVGGMKRCLQLILRYASRRSIATGRLLDNPVLVSQVATLSAALAAIEGLVTHIAETLDAGGSVPIDAYVVCKTAGPEWFWRAADSLVQFLGGRGYIETNVAPQLLRDARVTRILEGPTEALNMFLGSRVLNDGADFEKFIAQALGAPDVATRVAAAAIEIDQRCAAGPFTDLPSAKRWAHSLIGAVATDAVLLAVLKGNSARQLDHARSWASQQFEHSIAAALAASGATAIDLGSVDLNVLSADYTLAIGDIEQQLAGEDHGFDELLRSDASVSTALAADQQPPLVIRSDAVSIPGVSVPVPAPVTTSGVDIEHFVIEWMAQELKIPATSIDPTRSFFDYGIDSVTTVMLVVGLEEWLGCELYPELVYDFPIIRKFVERVVQQQATD